MKISWFNLVAICLVGLGVALAATPFAVAASSDDVKRTDVKISVKDGAQPATGAVQRAGIDQVPLTPASLAPAQAVEVHPYVPKLDTREMHTQRVWSSR
jgi:hypothetical protein